MSDDCLQDSRRPGTLTTAVLAHVRHIETPYDELRASGLDRREARRQVEDQARFILTTWQQS